MLEQGHHTADEDAQIGFDEFHAHFAALDLGKIQHGIDQPDQPLASGNRFAQRLLLLSAQAVAETLGKHGVVAQQQGERRSQLVGGHTKKLRFQGVELGQFAVGRSQLFIVGLQFG